MNIVNDPFQVWISRVCESEVTEKNYFESIRRFESWLRDAYGLEAKRIPARWREAKYSGWTERERFLDQMKDVLDSYFAFLKARGFAPLVVNRHMSTVTSFFHAFEIPVKSVRIRYAYVKYHNRDLEKEELRQILSHSTVRDRAIYLMLYESGMRPITLTKLRWKHVKEEFLRHKVPMKIELPSEILKCRVSERWTFIGEEGFEALKNYLVTRLPLKEDDYLFVTEKPQGRKLTTQAISTAFSEKVKKLGIAEATGKKKPKQIRLYNLKKAFKKFHAAPEDYKKFWMGRSDTSTHYVSRDVEYHRKLYAKGYENLRLRKPEISQEMVKKIARENRELKRRIVSLEYFKERVDKLEDLVGVLLDILKERDGEDIIEEILKKRART